MLYLQSSTYKSLSLEYFRQVDKEVIKKIFLRSVLNLKQMLSKATFIDILPLCAGTGWTLTSSAIRRTNTLPWDDRIRTTPQRRSRLRQVIFCCKIKKEDDIHYQLFSRRKRKSKRRIYRGRKRTREKSPRARLTRSQTQMTTRRLQRLLAIRRLTYKLLTGAAAKFRELFRLAKNCPVRANLN